MNIAYVRGNLKEQNIGRQFEAFKGYTIDRIRIYEDIPKMLNSLREGDAIYIECFLTLADTTQDLLEIINALIQKNVGFVSLKEKIDTTTQAGKLQLGVFSAMYQFQIESSKQRNAIDKSLTQHRPAGRPKEYAIDDNFIAVYHEWKAGNITAVKAMRLTNIKKVTFYKLVKQYEAQQENK